MKKQLQSEMGKYLAQDKEAIKEIAQKLDGYSIDTIIKLSKKALKNALQDENGKRDVTKDDFLNIISTNDFKNQKVNMTQYEAKNSRKMIGF